MPYHRLDVYQKSYQLALEVHRMTMGFPKAEQYEMGGQIRRSSKSIPVNIAEGMGKQGSVKDVKKFITIALGSCDETKVWLEFAKDLGYIKEEEFKVLSERYNEVGRMLRGLLNRYNNQ